MAAGRWAEQWFTAIAHGSAQAVSGQCRVEFYLPVCGAGNFHRADEDR